MRVTGAAQPVHFLLDIIELLNALGVPYSIVGALAVSLYGIPRSTNDGDTMVWLKGPPKVWKDLADRVSAAGYEVEVAIGDHDDPVTGAAIVRDQYGNRADLLYGIRGMDPDAQSRSTRVKLRNDTVCVMGPEDLIAMKLFAGGPKDLDDAKGILQVSEEKLDLQLLRRVTGRYGSDAAQKLDEILKTIAEDEA